MIENLIDRLAAIVDPAAFLPSATQYVDVRSQDAARKKAREEGGDVDDAEDVIEHEIDEEVERAFAEAGP